MSSRRTQIFAAARSVLDGVRLITLSSRDCAQYWLHHSGPRYERLDQGGLSAWLLFYTHTIEKGLTHEEFRAGFGLDALNGISQALRSYRRQGFPQSSLEYRLAISVLCAYKARHDAIDFDTPLFDKLVSDLGISLEDAEALGGTTNVGRIPQKVMLRKSFLELVEHRHSVRYFSSELPDLDEIREAVRLAGLSPSVCNRQATRVILVSDPKLVKSVLNLHPGFEEFDIPPVLVVLASDLRCFFSASERNECYVDGGLFAMSFLYALDQLSLAACMLSAMLPLSADRKIRKLVGVREYEVIIGFVVIGQFPESYTVANSARRELSEILREIPSPSELVRL